MDKKAISRIKKALTKNNCAVDKVRGCFVDEHGNIVAQLTEPFLAMPEEDADKYCEIFRKTLSGKPGKTLYSMEFPLAEETDGGKQVQLYRLLRSDFTSEEQLDTFFRRIIDHLEFDGKYLITLAHGVYDLPGVVRDGSEMDDASELVYQFLLCSICPVKEIKEGLYFDAASMNFIAKHDALGVQAPEIGFLFPAITDNTPDIHAALYFARHEDNRHPEFMDEMLGGDMPVSGKDQNTLFTEIIEQTLGRDCDFETVRAVTDTVNELVKQKEDEPEPTELGRHELYHLLDESGVPRDALEERFQEVFDDTVGEGNTITAQNIAGRSVMEIKSPSVKISVKTEASSMISTRVIDGREYLLIPIQDDIELNGIRLLTKRKPGHGEMLGAGDSGEEPLTL